MKYVNNKIFLDKSALKELYKMRIKKEDRRQILWCLGLSFSLRLIAVGGGGAGGAVAPPFGSKRRKSSKIWANGQFIWANSLDIWAH